MLYMIKIATKFICYRVHVFCILKTVQNNANEGYVHFLFVFTFCIKNREKVGFHFKTNYTLIIYRIIEPFKNTLNLKSITD